MDGGSVRAGRASLWILVGLLACLPLPSALASGTLVVIPASATDGERFRMQVQKALDYLSSDSLLKDVLARVARLEIHETAGPSRVVCRPHARHAIIFFNPHLAIRVDGPRVQSPALVLGHELAHVHRLLRGEAQVKNGRFTGAEEQAVVSGIETRLAQRLGEPVRRTHTGRAVPAGDVTLGRRPVAR